MKLTENQVKFLRLAWTAPFIGGWVCVSGVCLVGRNNARGVGFVLDSLVRRGLIQRGYTKYHRTGGRGTYVVWDLIRLTEAGKLVAGKLTGN